MVLTLYKQDISPPVQSVLMVIEAAKIPDVKYVDVNVLEGDQLKEEYLKINPQHTIPMLKDDDFFVWDSHAICVYLLTEYSSNKTLYPTDPKKRAIIDSRLHFDSGILFASLRNAIEPIIFGNGNSFEPAALEKIKKAYGFTDKFLTSPWLAGNEITLADICCLSSISSLNLILPIDENLFPNLTDWFKRCKEQDFYKRGSEPGTAQYAAVLLSRIR